MAKTMADLLARCSRLRQERPELTGKISEIFRTDQDPIPLDEAWQKIDDLVEGTTIEDVTDVFRKEA